MPRITKKLPAERADYSFGDLVYWHLFKYGTRPTGNPNDTAGRIWELDYICRLLGITHRTLRNWIADKHLPDSLTDLNDELFGNNPAWDEARLELQEKFEQGWAAKGGRSRKSGATGTADTEAGAGSDAEQGKADPAEPIDAKYEPVGDQDEKRPPTGALQPAPSVPLRPIADPARPPRWSAKPLVAALAIIVGAGAWMQLSRKPTPPPDQPKVAIAPPPSAPLPSPAVVTAPPKEQPAPAPVSTPAPPPVEDKRSAEVQPPVPSDEDKRAAEQRRLAEQLLAARQEAYDREKQRREDEARKLDNDLKTATDRQRQLDAEARTVAGIGYRLRENTSVAGSSYRRLLTGNIADCALACVSDNCDGFSWYRDQHPPGSPRRRTCYLFKRPFTTANYSGHAFGEPVPDPPTKSGLAPSGNTERPIRLAQAQTSKDAPARADNLTRCAGGPVKVTGFKLTCDQTLGGGTILGSHRLSHTVANINECAAKCRPIAQCVGFTFNSGDPPGQHACIIFGPKPEGRESKGWISGMR